MCSTPITIKKNTPDAMTVGCGRCIPCHLKYCNQWAFRFQVHANTNPIFWCVTLTYDGKHLPYVKAPNGKIYQTLMRSHASGFFKTLRNNHNKTYKKCSLKPKISYLICGEYGDQFKRPHYHAIIFGATPDDILKSWSKGSVYFGNSDLKATVNYTLKYALKSRVYKYYKDSYYERPFINVSKGIGEDLLLPYKMDAIDTTTGEVKKKKFYKRKALPELIENDGIRLQMPRYYAKKLGINIDTDQFREQAIEKHRDMERHLASMNITFQKFAKDYHNYIYFMDKSQHYNNEIITNLDMQIIKSYS